MLWTVMLIAFMTNLDLSAKNIIAMCCSALLMPTYFYASIIISVVSLILGTNCSQVAVCLAFVAFDILICILLSLEIRQITRTSKQR